MGWDWQAVAIKIILVRKLWKITLMHLLDLNREYGRENVHIVDLL